MTDEVNKQIAGSDRLDKIRIELDRKIEEKLSTTLFFWITGGLVSLFILFLGFINNQTINDAKKLDKVNDRLTIVETLIEERKNNKSP